MSSNNQMSQQIASRPRIVVQPATELAELRTSSDDWTGVTSAAQRRKLQNRLNQRARRRRQQSSLQSFGEQHSSSALDDADGGQNITLQPSNGIISSAIQSREAKCLLGQSETRTMLVSFAHGASEYSRLGSPSINHLTLVVRYNVFHAFTRNAAALGFNNEWLTYNAVSPFNKQGPGLGSHMISPCPASLLPADLQATIEHHPWIDFFPCPRMRDNFFTAILEYGEDSIDEDDLCSDVVDVGAGAGIEQASLIAWGNPWEPSGWEVTEPFLQKWGWLLRGCVELMDSTNKWRQHRGLKKLKFDP